MMSADTFLTVLGLSLIVGVVIIVALVWHDRRLGR